MVILLENLNFPAIFDIWKTSIWISRNFLYLGKSNLNCPAFFVKRKKVRENQISPFSYILCALESTYYLSLIAFYKQISYFTLADSGQAEQQCGGQFLKSVSKRILKYSYLVDRFVISESSRTSKVPWEEIEKEMQLLSFTPGSTRLKSMPCLPAFQLYKKDTLPILYVCLLVPPRPSKEVWVMHTNENSTKKNSKVAVKAVKELIFLRSTPLECLITVHLPIFKRQNQNHFIW